MARKAAIILILVMVTVGVAGLDPLQRVCAAGQTWIVTSTGDSGPGTLRSGLQNATAGDTVTFDSSVFPPTSPVNIKLTSELPHIIQGNLTIDASGAGVILNGSEMQADTIGLVVDSENNTIKGLQILHFPGCGIKLTANARACNISGNIIKNNERGIFLDFSSNNGIHGNNITDNDDGVYLYESSNNTISGNNITENTNAGIYFHSSSDKNSISGNDVKNNRWGIHFLVTSNCIITRNNVENNTEGVIIYRSRYTTITENNITSNTNHGIYLDMSYDGKVYHNNFIGNDPPFLYFSTNLWDNGYPSGGNYWSDYEDRYPNATEIDGTGIWDTPYEIDENNQDNYPLVHIIPEFPSFLILPLFIIATLLTAILLKRKKHPSDNLC